MELRDVDNNDKQLRKLDWSAAAAGEERRVRRSAEDADSPNETVRVRRIISCMVVVVFWFVTCAVCFHF